MSMRNLTPILPGAQIWSQLTLMRSQSRLAQALLVVVPPALHLALFLDRMLTHILCLNTPAPCGTCRMCLKILNDSHPDIHRVQPENSTGAIKIEQIRDLQVAAYQTPQLTERKIIVIYPAEAMNQAAASALLKVLEEPAESTMFILVATNPSLLLPTIVSRCQQLQVQQDTQATDPLALGKAYPETSPRGILYAQRFQILAGLDALLAKRLSPCDLAEQWSDYPIQDMLWFIASVITKLLYLSLLTHVELDKEYLGIPLLTKSWRPEALYAQLDSIYTILSQLHRNINLNTTLVWERICLDFLEATHHVD